MGGLSVSSFVGNFGFQAESEHPAEVDAQTLKVVLCLKSQPQMSGFGIFIDRPYFCQSHGGGSRPPSAALLSTPERFQSRSSKACPAVGGQHGTMLMIAAGKDGNMNGLPGATFNLAVRDFHLSLEQPWETSFRTEEAFFPWSF